MPLPAPFVTGAILKCICPGLSIPRAGVIADLMCVLLPRYGMADRDIFHEAVGTFAVESQQFLVRNENLHYSVDGLKATFSKYFTGYQNRFSTLLAKQYANQPMKIANRVYANRMGNGDEKSGDGWKMRGGGFCQLTGKDIWLAYAKYKKLTLEEALDYVRNTDEGALDSACWLFAIEKKLIDEAIADKILEIRKSVNGGTNGLKEFIEFVDRAKRCMPL